MPETRAIKAALEKTTGSKLAEGAVRNQVLKLRYKTSLGWKLRRKLERFLQSRNIVLLDEQNRRSSSAADLLQPEMGELVGILDRVVVVLVTKLT